jgi:hypothetical protein
MALDRDADGPVVASANAPPDADVATTPGQASGKSSASFAMSFAHVIREVSWERGWASEAPSPRPSAAKGFPPCQRAQ